MKSLYLRIWLTVVAALALFALAAGALMQRHLEQERREVEAAFSERLAGWAQMVENSLPEAAAPAAQQAAALTQWSQRLRLPLALDDAQGQRIAVTEAYAWREAHASEAGRVVSVTLEDGRRLSMIRPDFARHWRGGNAPGGGNPARFAAPAGGLGGWMARVHDWPAGLALVGLLSLLFVAVAAGAYPVVRGLTRRLERLRASVEAFGEGALDRRVSLRGDDEVAAVAASFNRAAQKIEHLVQANRNLLANASHELRSPLARLKMAVAMLEDAPAAARERLSAEIHANIAELDALVEEVLLSSRLEAGAPMELSDGVDLLALALEEAARTAATVDGCLLEVRGSERLLRRALRNLLENAQRYGGGQAQISVERETGGQAAVVRVCDRGLGVPEALRERIFEPFYRLPGHAEREGGVGLGLALVRQIAQRHGGQVVCRPRAGGGSCFELTLPLSLPLGRVAPATGGASPRP